MPVPTAEERIGTTLAGRFEFQGVIARGGMGVLFAGRARDDGRPVAIKLLRSDDLDDPERRARFLKESATASRLEHPHVVRVLATGECDGLPYLVMERLRGETLARRLGERSEAMAPAEALELLLPILGAVAFAHDRGVVHRDLKPDNIFLHRASPQARPVPKLLDFGIAKTAGSTQLTHSGVVVGTPCYMSPEQASDGGVGAASDVWSMGVILFRCLTGRLPFEAGSGAALLARIVAERAPRVGPLAPGCPPRLAAAVDRALEPRAGDRYPDMRALARALVTTAAAAGVELPAAPDPVGLPDYARWRVGDDAETDTGVQPVTRAGRRPAAAIAVGTLTAVAAAAAVAWLLGGTGTLPGAHDGAKAPTKTVARVVVSASLPAPAEVDTTTPRPPPPRATLDAPIASPAARPTADAPRKRPRPRTKVSARATSPRTSATGPAADTAREGADDGALPALRTTW